MLGEAEKAKSAGQNIYELCNDMVTSTFPGDSTLQFFPFLYDGPRGAPSGFMGITASTTLPDLLRAIYEGVVFAHRTDFNYLLTGPDAAKPDVIRFAGGPSRSEVWSQMFADGLGLPVEVANGAELGAKGGAICAAVATGVYASIPARAAALTAKYENYSFAVETNVQAWAKSKGAKKFNTTENVVRATAA
jgi:L-xylulokinase